MECKTGRNFCLISSLRFPAGRRAMQPSASKKPARYCQDGHEASAGAFCLRSFSVAAASARNLCSCGHELAIASCGRLHNVQALSRAATCWTVSPRTYHCREGLHKPRAWCSLVIDPPKMFRKKRSTALLDSVCETCSLMRKVAPVVTHPSPSKKPAR